MIAAYRGFIGKYRSTPVKLTELIIVIFKSFGAKTIKFLYENINHDLFITCSCEIVDLSSTYSDKAWQYQYSDKAWQYQYSDKAWQYQYNDKAW